MAERQAKTKAHRPKEAEQPRQMQVKLFLSFAAAVFTAVAALVVWAIQRPGPSLDARLTSIPKRAHAFSFSDHGVTVTGKSRSPFEKAPGYYARVEVCVRQGFEGMFSIVTCYLTIRPSSNIVITNSENSTAAIYDDGRSAHVCCISIDGQGPFPVEPFGVPPGETFFRRTFEREKEIQVVLTIPAADEHHQLDAISFSPGHGVQTVLFPIKDRIRNRMRSAAFVEAHKDDPRVRELMRQAQELGAEVTAGDVRD